MIKIKTYIVKPFSSKKENIILLISFFFLLLFAGIILKIRYKPHYQQTINAGEISAYNELNSIELGLYSDIKNSLTDMTLLKEENGKLPNIFLLQEEEIPPYEKDNTWEQRGAMEWTFFSHEDTNYYLGISQKEEIGNFLIAINEENISESEIFFTKANIPIEETLNDTDKYMELFKKIVPYTGNDERKKFKGE